MWSQINSSSYCVSNSWKECLKETGSGQLEIVSYAQALRQC